MCTLPENLAQRQELGTLIAEFRDIRAVITTIMGYAFAALGTFLLVYSLFHEKEAEPAFFFIIIGAVMFGVGRFFQKKRLAVYQNGIIQSKWGKMDSVLWRDVRQMSAERETHYDSGLAYKVRYHCHLERSDGTWLALDAVPITSETMKALRKSATLANIATKGNTQEFKG
jgi:hypothetical protein